MNEAATLMGHSDSVHCVVTYRSNGKPYLVSGSRDNIKIWDLVTQKLQYTLERHTNSVTSLAIFVSGKKISF